MKKIDFNNEVNLFLAKMALGEDLELFDLTNESDKRIVSFGAKAYLSGLKADGVERSAIQKLANPKYDSDGLLDKSYYLTDHEKEYLMGISSLKQEICVKDDIYVEPSGLIR